MEDIKFLVRVQCMTYNHAPYIEDAMNGFTMQQTNFPYICVIIDDASTDGESEVIQKYMQNNFELENSITQQDESDDYVRIFSRHKDNVNCYFLVVLLKYNHYSIKKAKGPYYKDWVQGIEYIATCEGDDYWINPLKLSKQVSYLDNNPSCGATVSFSKHFFQEKQLLVDGIGKVHTDFRSILLNGGIGCATCTVVYRGKFLNGYSKLVSGQKWLMGDFPLFLYISHNSDIYCFKDFFATYRILQESASHSTSYDKSTRFIDSVLNIQLFFANLYEPNVIETIEQNHIRKLFANAVKFSQTEDVKKYFASIKSPTFSDYIKLCKYYIKPLLNICPKLV